mmetsp:Transcript_14443/g.41525  ORF Transcript_14443/g.41525 Transcript_14443/m.41525 type:complete len:80 (+) Transcript_14443:70-309(+)
MWPALSRLVFAAPKPSYSASSFPGELMWIPRPGYGYEHCRAGDCFPAALLYCPNARYCVLYFHSNGEDIGQCHNFGCGF